MQCTVARGQDLIQHASSRRRLMKQIAFDFSRRPEPTLENFIVGRNAELVHNMRRLLSPHTSERAIYLWGASGSGRTHLLQGFVNTARASSAKAAYLPSRDLMARASSCDSMKYVAVDDVEALDDDGQRAMFNLCNDLRDRHAALVVSGNLPPARLALRADLLTRLAWGLVYEIHALSDEEKITAMQRRAGERGFALADDVGRFVLTRAPRDMAALLAIVDALDRVSLENKRPVTVGLARELLQHFKSAGATQGE
jgi:DnaA family protein